MVTSTSIWVVTSRAVVGSSKMMRSGRQDSAMAVIARWSWPAGYLVRVAEADLVGIRQLDPAIQVLGIGIGLVPGALPVFDDGLGKLVDELVRRVEGRRRALRHVGDARAAQLASPGFGHGRQFHAVKPDAAAVDAASRLGKAHGGDADRGLAGAGLPDQPEDLAPVQGDVHPLDDLVPLLVAEALDHETLHLEQCAVVLRVHRRNPSARP